MFASEETCTELRADAVRFVGTGALTSSTIDCRNVTSAGSHPGAQVVKISVLEPVASITAFRHLHSGTSYPESGEPNPFPITPVKNIADPRDADMYPPGIAHSFRTGGPIGGPISIYYHFVVRGDHSVKPKVYVPIHQTNAALPTSSLYFKVAYLKQLEQMIPALTPAQRPEPRWMVDPDDYLKPMVYDPKDARWSKGRRSGEHDDDHDD